MNVQNFYAKLVAVVAYGCYASASRQVRLDALEA